jgi:RNA ligase
MLVKIKSIKKIDSDSKRYDIQVKDNSNFFANTILVHNSLGIVFNYKGEWICASRGSFTSEYAIKIAELLKNYPVEFLYTQQTYCFELLWTLRPIVLSHAKDDIVMLASFVTETGEEMDVQIPYYTDRFNVVRKFDGLKDYKLLKEMVTDDMEGFVLRYKSGFRMKIKGANYCRLHNIITECSTVDIWKALKEGNGMSKFLENVPDEFDAWVHFQIAKMEAIFTKEWETAVDLYNKIYNKYGGLPDKKVFSDEVKLVDRKYQGILFNMYNEIPVDQIIWKYIRPVHEKPIF